MKGKFILGGSAKTQKIVSLLSALFEVRNGERVLGRIRIVYTFDTDDYTLVGFLGAHNGREIDLKTRTLIPDDPRAVAVLEAIAPYTDEEVFEAVTTQFAWDLSRSYRSSAESRIIEYSAGNPKFAAEGIRSIASLADSL